MARLLPRIDSLAPYAPGLSIDETRERFGLPGIIKLASNENPLGSSPMARAAAEKAAARIFRYPQGGNPRLREALASLHNVPADRIVAGNGSDEIIDMLIRMLAMPGRDNIVCFEPCFSIYPIQAQINGVETRRKKLEKDFSFDFSGLLELVDGNTKLVFITTPDNPTGYCPSLGEVRKLADALAKNFPGALLVIDEAYMDFADDEQNRSMLAAGALKDNVAFLRTFSKSWGLAGLRIGYGVLPAALADGFWRARLPFSINIIAEEAALAALRDQPFRQATLEAVRKGRADLKTGLEKLGCAVWPSQANFLFFKPPAGKKALECFEELLRSGIIIRSLKSYGMPEYLRVSIGNDEENGKFLKAMEKILDTI